MVVTIASNVVVIHSTITSIIGGMTIVMITTMINVCCCDTSCEHLPVSRVVMYSISLLVCFACLYKAYGSATYRIKAP